MCRSSNMADYAELQHMVMSFRVSELQVLLGFAGRNKSGRKQELLQRALALLDGCGAPIQIKIRELSKRRFPSKAAAAAAAASSSSSPHTSPLKQQPHAPLPQPGDLGLSGHFPVRNQSIHRPQVSGLEYKHTPAMPPNHNQVPVLPDVSLKMLPFYDVLDELLKPSSLVPKGAARFQETFFVFHLTPQQAQDVAASREMKSGRIEHSVQVQLRFCLLETSCDQEDNFPPSICVRVNGKMAPLPNPIPTNKAGVEPKRPSRPVNITSICRISPTHPNQISISWASELGRSYCVAVHLVRKLNSDILLSRMKRSGIKHPDHTTALIKEKLAHDPDNEIATTSLRVSLQCPLGKMRMTIPSRASTCNHLQCFDAPMFLLMNEKKPTWTCPVCDKPALFYNLIIDGLFTEILKKTSEMEIEFLEDGSWRPLKPKGSEPPSRSRSPVMDTSIQTIEGGTWKAEPADREGSLVMKINRLNESPLPKRPASAAKEELESSGSEIADDNVDTIDLTETDDEADVQPISVSLSSSCSESGGDEMSNSSVISMAPPSASGMPNLSPVSGTHRASPPLISLDSPPSLSRRQASPHPLPYAARSRSCDEEMSDALMEMSVSLSEDSGCGVDYFGILH